MKFLSIVMISAVILTKNNQDTIEKCLRSLKAFSEVVLIDNGSTDHTLSIAEKFPNVLIHRCKFTTFGKLRNYGAKVAKNEWILAIDADEELSDEAQKFLTKNSFESTKVYSFPFHNFYNGKWIKTCGWYPDRHIRLYNKNLCCYSEDLVHEKLNTASLEIEKLKTPFYHYSYRSLLDFKNKCELYSELFAEQNKGKKRVSYWSSYIHSFFAFFKCFVLKRGVVQGKEGYLISSYYAKVAFEKYRRLYNKNKLLP